MSASPYIRREKIALETVASLSPPALPVVKSSPWRITFAIAVLAFLWFILCRHLSNEWSANEQYSYGWFVPFFALFLFWLRWEDRPRAEGRQRRTPNVEHRTSNEEKKEGGVRIVAALLAIGALLLLLPIRLFEIGNPDWRPLGWAHALAVVTITLLTLWRFGGPRWLRHFAFPVCFILVAVPWVTPIEAPIVQGLMRVVAMIATETLALFGIPAQLEGSVIRISSGVVGVNEACSGVRSLQTSLMIGLLFGELKRLSIPRRVALVVAAAAIAFIANCARGFFLVWIAATRGVPAVEQWHDAAGYAILGAVFAGTMGIAALLGRKEVRGQKSEVRSQAFALRPLTSDLRPLTSFFLPCLAWLLFVEIAVESWYRSHEAKLVAREQWSVHWPEDAPGFRQIPINDEVKGILRFDEGRQVAWSLPASAEAGSLANAMLFFFRWEPGTGTILRARSHRPDICLPSVGWRQTGDYGVRTYPAGARLALPFRHFAFATDDPKRGSVVAHAFFCMREDKVQSDSRVFDIGRVSAPEWARSDRVRVVREGLRNPGQQVMQLVLIGTSDLTPDAAESRFAKLVPQLVTLGATPQTSDF